ncbi:MAG: AMP-binding protein [Acidimicrobiia bacterium]|nr:AMP-binding protein [Acidimicrobiia bacterium]
MGESRDALDVSSSVPAEVRDQWSATGVWAGETLTARLSAATAAFDATATCLVQGDVRLSLQDLDRKSAALARGLVSRGVEPGAVVAHQLPNWWQAVVLSWAVLRAGAVLAPITPALRASEVGWILERTRARLAVVPRVFRGVDHVELVGSARADTSLLVADSPEFDALLAPGEESDGALPEPGAGDPAVILFTSGTTAGPKGVVHTHETLRCETDSLVAPHGITPRDCLLLPMPLTHVAGFVYGVLFPALLGTKVVLMDRWDPAEALRTIERERVTFMIGTPVFLRTMLDRPEFTEADLSSLRLWSMGGAGVTPDNVREASAALPACWCKRTYGSTEYPTATTSYPGDPPEKCEETDGREIGSARVRIVDPVTGADVPTGWQGEVLLRGPEMCVGYLDVDEQTAAFDAEGWFRTGDTGVRDEDGYLTIVGRIKDIIIRGGENISAREVEEAVALHPAVADVAVVRMPDRVMGEKACAYVVLVPGQTLSLEALTSHLAAGGLAAYKWPERLEIRDELPRTDSGKVRKPDLEAEVTGLIGPETRP